MAQTRPASRTEQAKPRAEQAKPPVADAQAQQQRQPQQQPQQQQEPEDRRDRIAKAAYHRWQARGGGHGGHEQDWMDAEAEIDRQQKG